MNTYRLFITERLNSPIPSLYTSILRSFFQRRFVTAGIKMSSLRNAIPRRSHKERSQPDSRKKFGLLEKHKDYVQRAQAYHQKEQILQKLKEKVAFRNPDEFYFKMIKIKTVDGVHMPEIRANKYTKEELMLMKMQDMGYILQKLQAGKKKIEKLTASLHVTGNQSSSKHVYYAEEREEAKQIKLKISEKKKSSAAVDLPNDIERKVDASYKELEDRKTRVKELEDIYAEMAIQKELQKKGKKRKLREDEIVNPTSYKWRKERLVQVAERTKTMKS